MLDHQILEAVDQGVFHIHTVEHVTEGLELLTGVVAGSANKNGIFPRGSALRHAQKTLLAYRKACQASEHSKTVRKRSH